MKIKVKYNGRRFPRIVSVRGGGKQSFQPERKLLEIEEYDTMLLLKSNSRMTPNMWEFAIVGVVEDVVEKAPDFVSQPPEDKPEKEKPLEEPPKEEKPPEAESPPKPKKKKKKKRMAT